MAEPPGAERCYGKKKLQGWLERAVRTAVIGMPATDRGRLSGEGRPGNGNRDTAPLPRKLSAMAWVWSAAESLPAGRCAAPAILNGARQTD